MTFPSDRPIAYDPTLQYSASDEVWQASLDLEDSGGGKNVDRIIVIGRATDGSRAIYFN